MPLYTVRIEIDLPIVVQAEDEDHAWDIAKEDLRDVFMDVDMKREARLYVAKHIKSAGDLPEKWDDRCIPYGGDGNTRIAELLAVE